jgi:flagellar basal-body rod modification protein FlgD
MTTISGAGTDYTTKSASDSTQSSSTKASGDTLGYDAFLKLLMAQMQNQDPMQPMNSSDYVAQLATFSQVEKTIELKDRVTDLLSTAKMQQAEGLIGKTVVSSDGEINGVVSSAKVVGSDVVAVLKNGKEVTIGPGVVISGTSQ